MPKTFSFLDKPVEGPFAIGERPDGAHVRIKGAKFGADALASIDDVTPTKRVDSVLNPHNYSLSELYKAAKWKVWPGSAKPKPTIDNTWGTSRRNTATAGGGAAQTLRWQGIKDKLNWQTLGESLGVTKPKPATATPAAPVAAAAAAPKKPGGGFFRRNRYRNLRKVVLGGVGTVGAGGTYLATRGDDVSPVKPPAGSTDAEVQDQNANALKQQLDQWGATAGEHARSYWPVWAAGGAGAYALYRLLKRQQQRKKRRREHNMYESSLGKAASLDLDAFAKSAPLLAGFLTACGENNLNETEIQVGLVKAASHNPQLMVEFEKFAAPTILQKPQVLPDTATAAKPTAIPTSGAATLPTAGVTPAAIPAQASATDTAVDKTIPTPTAEPQATTASPAQVGTAESLAARDARLMRTPPAQQAGARPQEPAVAQRETPWPHAVGDPSADDPAQQPLGRQQPLGQQQPPAPYADDQAAGSSPQTPAETPAETPTETPDATQPPAPEHAVRGAEALKANPEAAKEAIDTSSVEFRTNMMQNELAEPAVNALRTGETTPEIEEGSLERLRAENPEADEQTRVQQHAAMSLPEKIGLWGGIGLSVIGLMMAASGKGGLGSMLLTLLGAGIAGGAAAHGGMFGQEAQDFTQGAVGQGADWLSTLFGGGAAPEPVAAQPAANQVDTQRDLDWRTNMTQPGLDEQPAVEPAGATAGTAAAMDFSQALSDPAQKAQLMAMPDAEIVPQLQTAVQTDAKLAKTMQSVATKPPAMVLQVLTAQPGTKLYGSEGMGMTPQEAQRLIAISKQLRF